MHFFNIALQMCVEKCSVGQFFNSDRSDYSHAKHHCYFNPSAWSDERCSSWRKHHLLWSDKHCSSCCTLSLIRLYLDNIGRKCNRAALYVFMKELALLLCGRQFLQIIDSFFSLISKFGFLFAVPNFTGSFMGHWN